MISIKEAINSGVWLHCEYKYSSDKELTKFRLKILSFRKLNLSEVDDPQEIKLIDENTTIWIMDLEVVNLTKETIYSDYGSGQLVLVDQAWFEYEEFNDSHLRCYSEFAEKSNLKRFFAGKLIPKIKAIGAILFQLPNDYEDVYSLSISIKRGSIKEV